MSMEPFVGEIAEFGFEFAPVGWADCAGQTLPINQYQALFALLGTTYGGDGIHTFGLPDLRPYREDFSYVVNPAVAVVEMTSPQDPTKHAYTGKLIDNTVGPTPNSERVDWREKGIPRKCIALQGIFPSRP